MRKYYNAERRWRGRSYRKGGKRIRELRDRIAKRAAKLESE